MSELDDKLGRILNDPQAMREIMDMAAAFRNSAGEAPAPSEGETGEPGIDPDKLSRIMRIAGQLGGDGGGSSLLRAIKPYLNPRRQAKFNDALSVMRMARLIPYIKKEGLL